MADLPLRIPLSRQGVLVGAGVAAFFVGFAVFTACYGYWPFAAICMGVGLVSAGLAWIAHRRQLVLTATSVALEGAFRRQELLLADVDRVETESTQWSATSLAWSVRVHTKDGRTISTRFNAQSIDPRPFFDTLRTEVARCRS